MSIVLGFLLKIGLGFNKYTCKEFIVIKYDLMKFVKGELMLEEALLEKLENDDFEQSIAKEQALDFKDYGLDIQGQAEAQQEATLEQEQ